MSINGLFNEAVVVNPEEAVGHVPDQEDDHHSADQLEAAREPLLSHEEQEQARSKGQHETPPPDHDPTLSPVEHSELS
jgi:hypothetical protein